MDTNDIYAPGIKVTLLHGQTINLDQIFYANFLSWTNPLLIVCSALDSNCTLYKEGIEIASLARSRRSGTQLTATISPCFERESLLIINLPIYLIAEIFHLVTRNKVVPSLTSTCMVSCHWTRF